MTDVVLCSLELAVAMETIQIPRMLGGTGTGTEAGAGAGGRDIVCATIFLAHTLEIVREQLIEAT